MTTLSLPVQLPTRIRSASARIGLLLALAAGLGLGAYLLTSTAGGYLGYPLDDGWIHQTYARNIAQRGEFSFVPGVPSAGSTAPLWSLALALGHVIAAEPRFWSFALGYAALVASAVLAYRQGLAWIGSPRWALVVGLAVALEWHLIWAAASGMETLLFTALSLAALTLPPRHGGWLGALTGLAIATRPDGWLLVPFVAARVALEAVTFDGRLMPTTWRRALAPPLARFGLSLALSLIPYLALNLSLNGSIFPNTMAAKAVEQAFLFELPWLERAFWHCSYLPGGCEPGPLLQPWVGGQALLLPGLFVFIVQRARRRDWAVLIPAAWALAFLCAYAYRLPIIYQHGRYQIPTIPVLLISALAGMAGVVRLDSPRLIPRVLSRVWIVAGLATLAAFNLVGARTYARDVAFIETEMVAGALWIRDNTPADAVVAAHDIGALGYLSGRHIRDLAGLVDPEIIPMLTDEGKLMQWMDSVGVDYVMTMERFTPRIVAEHPDDVVYVSPHDVSSGLGYDRTLILRWGFGGAP